MVICFDGDRTLWDLNYDYEDCYKDLADWMRKEFKFHAIPLDMIETAAKSYIKYENKKGNYHRSVFPLAIMKTFNSVYLYETGITPNVELLSKALQIGERIFDTPPTVKSETYDMMTTLEMLDIAPRVLVTAGDRVVQNSKIFSTGVEPYFYETRVVTRKSAQTYTDIYNEYKSIRGMHDGVYICQKESDCIMIGDSVKHDINPAIEAGWYAIYIPSKRGQDAPLNESSRLIIAESLLEVPAILHKIRND